MGMTLIENILAIKTQRDKIVPDEIITVDVDVAMTHDALGAHTIAKFKDLVGNDGKVWDKNKIVVILDHYVPANNIDTRIKLQTIEKFVDEQELPNYYGVGKGGICHKTLIEKGFVVPGEVVTGTDSHTTTYGVMGTFAFGMGIDDMASIWKTGRTWVRVPWTILVNIDGRFRDGIFAKDIMLHIVRTLGIDAGIEGGKWKAIQFIGPLIEEMSLDSRAVLTNMAIECGALNGIIEPDDKVVEYLNERTEKKYEIVRGNPDAQYDTVVDINANNIDEPLVAEPPTPANVNKVSRYKGLKVNQAFIGSCTNGKLEDLRITANILKNRKVARTCTMIVIPASQEVRSQAAKEGLFEIFADAGAEVGPTSCGPCMETHCGILGPNDVMISSANRNFIGRAGHPTAKIYLASPATAAASAVAGEIVDPRDYLQ